MSRTRRFAEIDLTTMFTAQGGPCSQSVRTYVRDVLFVLDKARRADLEIVWEQLWTPEMMTKEAKEALGMG